MVEIPTDRLRTLRGQHQARAAPTRSTLRCGAVFFMDDVDAHFIGRIRNPAVLAENIEVIHVVIYAAGRPRVTSRRREMVVDYCKMRM